MICLKVSSTSQTYREETETKQWSVSKWAPPVRHTEKSNNYIHDMQNHKALSMTPWQTNNDMNCVTMTEVCVIERAEETVYFGPTIQTTWHWLMSGY